MSVATFFQDRNLGEIITAHRPVQAAETLRDFLAVHQFHDCSCDELLALADLSFLCRDFEASRTALEQAQALGEKLHLVLHKIARLDFVAQDYASAAANLARGCEEAPDFPYNWLWSAKARHLLGEEALALEHAERFIAFGIPPYSGDELHLLAELAHAVFVRGDRLRSRAIYEYVDRFGPRNALVRLRYAEALMAGNEHARALELLEPLDAAMELNGWGRTAMANCHSQVGNHDRAIGIIEEVVAKDPNTEHFFRIHAEILMRSDSTDRIRAALARTQDNMPAAARAELRARVLEADGAIEAAVDEILSVPLRRNDRLYYLAFEMAYRALGAGQPGLALRVSNALTEVAPGDIHTKSLRIDILFQQQDWDAAAEILHSIRGANAMLPQVVLKRFEYYCFVGDIANATLVRQELEGLELPSKAFTLPIFRFLAEKGAWGELVDRAIGWLDDGFRYEQIGYVLFRAAKKTQRHGDMVAAVEAIPGWAEKPDLCRLRAALLGDAARTLADFEQLATDPHLARNPVLQHKLDAKRAVWARGSTQRRRNAVFLCTNQNYLCATAVALHSAIELNPDAAIDYFVVVDNELVEAAEAFLRRYRDDGHAVKVVPAQHVVDSTANLNAEYGLFTSGHSLAASAYYRIFFARTLQRMGVHERAIYLDSDIIVRRGFDELFNLDLEGKPIAARIETPRPEVARATRLNGIEDGRYFNSGILVFDLLSDRLTPGLARAVKAIDDETVTLMFQDQCALNIGFDRDFHALDMRFNYPVGEADRLDAVPENTAILHYLDRPKPWSAAYAGDCSTLWFEHWQRMASHIGETRAMELFGLTSD